MKISIVVLTAALAGQAVATWGFGKAAYNKWHESELERWLSDHQVPYSKPADRKDLEKLVHDNWQTKVVDGYQGWEAPQLQSYLSETGQELDQKQKADQNWLIEKVKKSWSETEKTADAAYGNVKDWIFDSWSESALKNFLDRHNVPNPTPPTRQSYIDTAKGQYDSIVTKLGETASYPGNWLYESWTEKDLKTWLSEHGYPVPKRASREDLVSSVRRNSRWASLRAKSKADKAANTVSDSVFDSWSESSLKEFLDKNNVKVPQGSNKNELLALARRNKAYYLDDTVAASLKSGYNSAASSVGSAASEATDTAAYYKQATFDSLIDSWSDTRLKAFLDSRGVPVPQASKRDELLAKVRLHKHKAATGYGAWTFDTWTYDNLKQWLEARGQKVNADTAKTRADLLKQANSYYAAISASAASTGAKATDYAADSAKHATDSAASVASEATDAAGTAASNAASAASEAASNGASKASEAASSGASKATDAAASGASKATDAAASGASKAGEYANDASRNAYASLTSAMAAATGTVKDATFDTWSDSDLKSYLDTYGIKTYQGTTRNEMVALARRNAHAFMHGSDDQGVLGQAKAAIWGIGNQIAKVAGFGKKQADQAYDAATERASEATAEAKAQAESARVKASAKGEL